MTRLSRAGWVRFLHAPASTALFALCFLVGPAAAQQRDTLRVPQPARIDTIPLDSAVRRDSLIVAIPVATAPVRRPISPSGAFLQSFLLPGRGQITLGRKNAARFYIAVEAVGIGMTVHSLRRLREAKRLVGDSTAVEWRIDPATGDSVPIRWEPGRFTPQRVDARRTHVEDWVALLIFNHLLSGADAYVTANLWDFPTRMSFKARPIYGHRINTGSAPPPIAFEATLSGSITW